MASVTEFPDGSLRGPDGVVYRLTPQRVKRSQAGALVERGAPVVTEVYPEGLRWHGGQQALDAWSQIAPRLAVRRPPPVRDLQWVGHVWRSDDGQMLLRFDGQH